MDESMREVLKYFVLPQRTSEDIRQFVIVILSIIAAVVIVEIVRVAVTSRRERRLVLKSAKKHQLTDQERSLISELTAGKPRINPQQVFGSISEFHRLFGPLMHELAGRSGTDPKARHQLDKIFTLRNKLFGEVAYHFGNINSTIQLKSSQKLNLHFNYNGEDLNVSSVVVDVDEAAITVANTKLNGEFLKIAREQSFKVSFYRENDGYYEFQTHALRTVEENGGNFILLAHAKEIERLQSRSFYRKTVHMPFKFRHFAWDESLENRYLPGIAEFYEEKDDLILDISGGGLLFNTKEKLSRGDLLVFDLHLTEEQVIHDLLGKVLNVEQNPADLEKYKVHLKFVNIRPGEQELIVQLIQQKKI